MMNGDQMEYEIANANTPKEQRADWPMTSFDARDWATAFCQRFPTMDESDMLAWFAAAIMTGYDRGHVDAARAAGVARVYLYNLWTNDNDGFGLVRQDARTERPAFHTLAHP